MDSNDTPHPQAQLALQKHRPMLCLAYGLLEDATELSRGIFAQASHPYNPWYYAHTVRYHLLRLLVNTRPDAGFPYQVFSTPNTGIELYHRHDRLKVWKATFDGELPPPGPSSGRKGFINQPHLPFIDWPPSAGQTVVVVDPAKLVILWDTDSQHSLNEINLVCPEGWEEEWKPGTEHWRIAVPHPAHWIDPAEDFSADSGTADEAGNLSSGDSD